MTLEQDIQIFKRVVPDSKMSESELKAQLLLFRKMSPHADLESTLRKSNDVWNDFKTRYPHANYGSFYKVNIDGKFGVFYKGPDGVDREVFGDDVSDRKTWPQALKKPWVK